MHAYAEQRTLKRQQRRRQGRTAGEPSEQARVRAEEAVLQQQRRQQRWDRQTEDKTWRTTRQAYRQHLQTWQALSRADKRQHRAEHQAILARWRLDRAARREQQQAHQTEDELWRQARQHLRQRLADLDPTTPAPTEWLAILVVVDNCTRRCLGLPLFTAGAHVTSEMVVAALGPLLPAELQFLISDNGPQFIADTFTQLAKTADFTHVRIAPRRACTNGIAERFVQTLKDWVAGRTWTTPQEMAALLSQFLTFYNDRPHQGAELNGLSPNEYARRLATCSTC